MKDWQDYIRARVAIVGECWIWQLATHRDGYGLCRVGSKLEKAHRVSYRAFKGEIPDGLLVLHNCPDGDKPACVNPDHLWAGTHADNTFDMIEKGRHGTAKISGEDARKIIELHDSGKLKVREIGELFDISGPYVWAVIRKYRSLV